MRLSTIGALVGTLIVLFGLAPNAGREARAADEPSVAPPLVTITSLAPVSPVVTPAASLTPAAVSPLAPNPMTTLAPGTVSSPYRVVVPANGNFQGSPPLAVAPRATLPVAAKTFRVVPSTTVRYQSVPRTTNWLADWWARPARATVQYRIAAPGTVAYAAPTGAVTGVPTVTGVPIVRGRPIVSKPATTVTRKVRPVYLGRGIIGQPKLYVEGQPVRNALRFLTP